MESRPCRAASRGRRCRGAPSRIEARQPVIRRVLLGLAPCRDSERGLNEAIEEAALVHDELPDMNELAPLARSRLHIPHYNRARRGKTAST